MIAALPPTACPVNPNQRPCPLHPSPAQPGAGQVLWQRVRAGPHLQLPQGARQALGRGRGGGAPWWAGLGARARARLDPAGGGAARALAGPPLGGPCWQLISTSSCAIALQAYFILDELLLAGELQETSKKAVRLRAGKEEGRRPAGVLQLLLRQRGMAHPKPPLLLLPPLASITPRAWVLPHVCAWMLSLNHRLTPACRR